MLSYNTFKMIGLNNSKLDIRPLAMELRLRSVRASLAKGTLRIKNHDSLGS